MNILQQIFFNNLVAILQGKYRPTVLKNVRKMIHCGDPKVGGTMYVCPKCGTRKFVPFRCRSRFCPVCGNLYNTRRNLSMSFKLLNCQHRHCVFTIDESLREFFRRDRKLLNCLFDAVRLVVLQMFKDAGKKKENLTPGIIMVLHTFGRDLKWNPHIHCLITEGGICDNGHWKADDFFPFAYLRKAFKTVLLQELAKHITLKKDKARLKTITGYIYKKNTNGFYVYSPKKRLSLDAVVKYIGRYLGRPVIATSRIDNYDAESNMVTFHYNRHEDNAYVQETVPAINFINRLVQHIPEENFKMVRYAGVYARPRSTYASMKQFISPHRRKVYAYTNHWATSIYLTFGYNPIACPCCGRLMCVEFMAYGLTTKVYPGKLYDRWLKRNEAGLSSA